MQYLSDILQKKSSYMAQTYSKKVRDFLYPIIREWAGDNLREIFIAGSSAKGTALKGKSDVDLFISIHNTCTNSCSEIFNSLHERLTIENFQPRKQNVSLGIKLVDGNIPIEVDVVPAKSQPNGSNSHWLYKSKSDTLMQTNVKANINLIKNSGRINEIKLTKMWRNCHNLDISSTYLELSVIEARKNKTSISLDKDFRTVLEYLANDFISKSVVDPNNSNNIISDELTAIEKIKLL